MLRFLYISCDILATIFAIISPVAIFHWLLRAVNIPGLAPFLTPLNNFFDPMNGMVEAIFHPPAINYSGNLIPTDQGVVACILTAAFFLMNFASEYLKTTEQRQDVSRQANLQRQRLNKLKEAQTKTHKTISTNRRYMVHVNYDFMLCPSGGEVLARGLPRQAGNVLERYPGYMTVEFPTLQQAIQYCMEASQAMLGYYATLRPADPQPPFRIGVHAVGTETATGEASAETRRLVNFAGPNNIVFTQDIRDLLDAQGQTLTYHFQSIGMYALEGRQQELFKLFNSKPKAGF